MDADILDPSAFAAADRDGWVALAGKALKGASFAEALVSKTDDGIAVQPLYDRLADAVPLARSRPDAPWTISQRFDDPDAERALAQLADDLGNGATGVSIVAGGSASAFGLGVDGQWDGFADRLVEALGDRPISVRLEGGGSPALGERLRRAATKLSGRALHYGIDPFTAAALSGRNTDLDDLPAHFAKLASTRSNGTVLNADGRLIHNAGGTEAQELAVVAAAVAGYLRWLEAAGHSPEDVLSAISLCLSASQDQLPTMAKARAARLIFARIAQACGVDPAIRAHLCMETSFRMLTRRDPETNILRNTIAVFSAGTGGADEISVLPHTLPHGIPDPLARRLARNTQWILIAESHLDHVSDPAAGSGGIEALTEALAEKAWGIFGDIERQGGLGVATGNGMLVDMVARSRAGRAEKPIVGTTLFGVGSERPVTVLGPLAAMQTGGLRPVRRDEEVGV